MKTEKHAVSAEYHVEIIWDGFSQRFSETVVWEISAIAKLPGDKKCEPVAFQQDK